MWGRCGIHDMELLYSAILHAVMTGCKVYPSMKYGGVHSLAQN